MTCCRQNPGCIHRRGWGRTPANPPPPQQQSLQPGQSELRKPRTSCWSALGGCLAAWPALPPLPIGTNPLPLPFIFLMSLRLTSRQVETKVHLALWQFDSVAPWWLPRISRATESPRQQNPPAPNRCRGQCDCLGVPGVAGAGPEATGPSAVGAIAGPREEAKPGRRSSV